ncbi:Nucleoside-diphosphate-sugar epimerase [Evansella caseinilytica]|uniref:Nucleoside-diphosphate-sugar epimerase n=1 Tax=Evansella caseinilytica TaxID=1503961 RepID=A0A1H3H5V9_9BACI|nr:NAD-dependent epimerase/dehydratase family protein [Evansella caseinilytica]SDY10298.1 Nucleoside-diphosphate-sugar epimerase [Evansella caseinilytica]
MKIFLTGGTGLLGSNIVKELVNGNYKLKLLARSYEKAQKQRSDGVDIVQGDLKNIASFAPELQGCDVLIHAGAYFTEFFKKGNEDNSLHEINVKGTERLLTEAYERGIKNIIYVSSTGVLDTSGGKVVDENAPYHETTENPYFKSKIEAEKCVLDFSHKHPDVRIITILPAIMMGPGDYGLTRMGEFVLSFLKEGMPAVLPVKAVIVDARDVAKAIVAAIDKGRQGERYIVGGDVFKVKEIVKILSEVSGKPVPKRRPSFQFIMVISGLMAIRSKITGKPSPIPRRDELQRLRNQQGYSYTKAKKELRLTFRPLRETIADTVSWFEEKGGL